MSYAATIRKTVQVAGESVSSTLTRTGEGLLCPWNGALDAAVDGTITTRTDDNTGVLTLGSGHGLTDSDTVGVYWDGGVRYGMTITAYDTTTITVDGGAGDNLPVLTTVVYAGKETTIDTDFTANDLEYLLVHATARASVEFKSEADASHLEIDVAADQAWDWMSDLGVANPMAGDTVGKIVASSGSTTAATVTISALINTVS